MAYYSLYVFVKDKSNPDYIEDVMDPFYAYTRVDPYIERPYQEVKKFLADIVKSNKESGFSCDPLMLKAVEKDDIDALKLYNKQDHRFFDIDDEGNAISIYNPNPKWDECTFKGEEEDYLNPFSIEHCMKVSELQIYPVWEYSEEKLASMYPEEYETYKYLTVEGGIGHQPERYQKMFPTFVDFVIKQARVFPEAFIDENGEWHESGHIGDDYVDTLNIQGRRQCAKEFLEAVERNKDGYITRLSCRI